MAKILLYTFYSKIATVTLASYSLLSTRLEPIMLKNLPIIPSRTSQKFYPLFLIYSQIITYYSYIILLIYWVSKNNVQNAYKTIRKLSC